MNNELVQLDWDTNFFNIIVGKLSTNSFSFIESDFINNVNDYDLVYVFSSDELIKTKTNLLLVDVKIDLKFQSYLKTDTFHFKNIVCYNPNYHSTLINEIYELAFLSGTHSRFKIDQNFSSNSFQNLYKTWVDNIIKSSSSFLALYIEDDILKGFITIENKLEYARIGLISVNEKYQGAGIGKALVNFAKNYVLENDTDCLYVATQEKNINACIFYEKNQFKINTKTYIYHFWNTK